MNRAAMTRNSAVASTVLVPVYSGVTANEAWLAALAAFKDGGPAIAQSSRNGDTREILHAVLAIADPRQRWISARQPALNPAFAIAEALWMVWGRKDAALPVFFNSAYPKFSGAGDSYAGAYGHRLRAAFGVDQLVRAADALTASSDTRQVVLQIWNGNEDLPSETGNPRREDIPCNLLSILKVRDGRLHWTQVLRSNDLILGVPYNVVQFTILQEIMAGWIGVEIGQYTHLSDSLHLYKSHWATSTAASERAPAISSDNLALPRPVSMAVLSDLEVRVNRLISPSASKTDFTHVLGVSDLPPAYENLLAIMGAAAARKRNWFDIAEVAASRCSNRGMVQLWESWVSERPSGKKAPPS